MNKDCSEKLNILYDKINNNTSTLEERKYFVRVCLSNSIAYGKLYIRKTMKERDKLINIQRYYEKSKEETKDLVEKAEYEINISGIQKDIEKANKKLADIGKELTESFESLQLVASYHDFAQLCNANWKNVERAIKELKNIQKPGESKDITFIDLIFIEKVEQDENMPFFEALYCRMVDELKNNEILHEKSMQLVDEMFPTLKDNMYIAKEDLEGNVYIEKKFK